MAVFLYSVLAIVGGLAALLYAPIRHQIAIYGLTQSLDSWVNVHGLENHIIEDTVACEDIHFHETSGLLYSACAGDLEKAAGWFPG